MNLLHHLLASDPSGPRLTVYTESTGARLDFSAQTLDNWASKIANFLEEELELSPGDTVCIDLPVSWQAAVIALGALAANLDFTFSGKASAVFTAPGTATAETAAVSATDCVIVTEDPFGRGVEEIGGTLPAGAIDFGPTVRFYGDDYYGDSPALPDLYPTAGTPRRLLSTGWTDRHSFEETVLHPLAAGGSAVIVAGLASAERLTEISRNEKVTDRA